MARKIPIAIAVFCLVAFGAWTLTRAYAVQQIQALFRKDTPVSLEDIDVFFLGVSARKASGIVGVLPVSIEDIACHVALPSLFLLATNVDCNATFLGGTINLHSQGGLFKSPIYSVIGGKIQDVHIDKYPLARLAGITQGALAASFSDLQMAENRYPKSGVFEASIQGFSMPRAQKLSPPLVPLPLTIPALKNLDLTTRGKVENGTLNIQELLVASSLGTVQGTATLSDVGNMRASPSIHAQLQVELSEQGFKTVGPWLGLLAGQGEALEGASITITGNTNQPRINVVR